MAKQNPMRAVQRKPAKKQVRSTTTRKKTVKKKSNSNTILYITLITGGVLAAVLFAYHAYQEKKEERELSDFVLTIPAGFESVGIDVSHHQGEVNWKKVFAQSPLDTLIDFVYCKATEGSTHIDREWENNREQLNELGVMNGAYHFLNPKTYSIPQAQHFLNHWKSREIDLPPVLDVETEASSDKILIANMYDWLEYVEKHTGHRPIIYTSQSFYETKFQDEFENYSFWIAAYSKKPSCINDKRIIHWQFTDQGLIPEIDHTIDVNVSKQKF